MESTEIMLTLIEALATVGAFIVAGVAVIFAWRSLMDEKSKSRRQEASGVSAWWVTQKRGDDSVYGVVIRNDSRSPRHNVAVEVKSGNYHSRKPITMMILPPGTYYFESLAFVKNDKLSKHWSNPQEISALTNLSALTFAKSHQITAIEYDDSVFASRWRWSLGIGLTEVKGNSANGASAPDSRAQA